jgi:hypothetical protein
MPPPERDPSMRTPIGSLIADGCQMKRRIYCDAPFFFTMLLS